MTPRIYYRFTLLEFVRAALFMLRLSLEWFEAV